MKNGTAGRRIASETGGKQAGLKCIAEERFADINLVQDVIEDPRTKQRLVCGFKVKLPMYPRVFNPKAGLLLVYMACLSM